LHNATGRNTLLVAPPEPTLAVLSALLPSLLADWQHRFGQSPEIILLDGNRAGAGDVPLPARWLQAAGVDPRTIPRRDAEQTLIELQRVMSERLERESVTAMATGGEGGNDSRSDDVATPTLLVITPLERFREFRQAESFQFSLDAPAEGTSGPEALQAILRDGPQANLFTLLCCHSAETLTRWLPRSAHHDLELRLLARMSAADSSNLIDSPAASELSPATMLLYDDADGRLQKFRYCDPPPPAQVQAWLRG
jgi:S-DNA-T family DNA segregation ATPase FtsK/SpoIIIE